MKLAEALVLRAASRPAPRQNPACAELVEASAHKPLTQIVSPYKCRCIEVLNAIGESVG